jgi:hypothetical protein
MMDDYRVCGPGTAMDATHTLPSVMVTNRLGPALRGPGGRGAPLAAVGSRAVEQSEVPAQPEHQHSSLRLRMRYRGTWLQNVVQLEEIDTASGTARVADCQWHC